MIQSNKVVTPMTPKRALTIMTRLRELHPDAHCALDHASPFQLLCATVMSAQTTDVAVNKVTPGLFAAYPTPAAMAQASPLAIEDLINRIGMYRQKAKNLVGLSKLLIEKHAGEVPKTLAALVELPGVGRKTANVVLGVCFGTPEGVVVDTHVGRLAQRLGLSDSGDPVKVEQDLARLLPRLIWDITSHTLIFHGRRVCDARKPNCIECGASDLCPSAFHAEQVGRKPSKASRAQTKVAPTKTVKNAANSAQKLPSGKTAKKPASKSGVGKRTKS